MISPSVGVTYMNVKESLSFLGIDSGIAVLSSSRRRSNRRSRRDFKAQSFPNGIDDNTDGIIDNAINIEPGPSSVSSGSTSSAPAPASGTAAISSPTPFALLPATIDISTSSNIVGPTGGLRYLIGGKSFHLIGETKFGVMADFEQIGLSGNNIGSTTRVNGNSCNFQPEAVTSHPIRDVENQQDLIIPTPANPESECVLQLSDARPRLALL